MNDAAVFKTSKPTMTFLLVIAAATVLLVLAPPVGADPRAGTVEMSCSRQREHNTTLYVPNFVATMDKISNQMQGSPFGVAVTGRGPDASYGLAQCYGDLSTVDCLMCYAQARTLLPRCYPFNGGRIFLDGCFMRGENYSFFREIAGPGDKAVCGKVGIRAGPAFDKAVRRAVGEAIEAAVRGDGYARGEAKEEDRRSCYVLVNCWRTLNASSCRACLEKAAAAAFHCLPRSARALQSGCFMRYSDQDFLNAEQKSEGSRGTKRNNVLRFHRIRVMKCGGTPLNAGKKTVVLVLVAMVISTLAVLAVGGALAVYIWKHRRIQRKRRGSNDVKNMAKILHDSSLNFKFSTVEKATGSFNEAYKLGQGGFGTVYKGVLADGREIAVKRLFQNNRHRAADFYNEVNIISSVEHRNLVRLLGCSCSGPESLLIYEYLPNESLDRFIFDSDRGKTMNWERRFEIINGTVEGLVYLHENNNARIIHRDIKASNILLDSRFRAKIADFGLARSFQEDKSHISTAIAGTLGYMAPEYLAHGQLTEKADVYSFGVLLLEIVTGRQNNKSKGSEIVDSLVITMWRHFQEGTVDRFFDPNLMLHTYQNRDIKNEVLRVVHIGLLCAQEIPSLRPTMSKVLDMLTKKTEELPAPSNPPFVDEQTMEFNHMPDSPSYPLNPMTSNANISHSSFYPR